ncbi:MAG TPA: oxidoreductase [Bacteroidota bacterium]|nr:oxidoreductase [Bacteroidota bacterium]
MNEAGKWTARDIPDQQGKIMMVTGASSGIGFVAARELAGRGAHVILAVRDAGKGEAAMRRILEAHADASLELQLLDLADLRSVRNAAAMVRARHPRLDVLLNNAGVMIPPLTRTAQGFELQMGVNHLGHFALTTALLDTLEAAPAARVVTVSSGAHKIGRIDFEDLHWTRRRYNAWRAYADSKQANLLFTLELQRRLAARASRCIAVAAHPGVSMTELQRHSATLVWMSKLIAHDVETAALPSLRAATDPGVRGGEYFGPGKMFELRGTPERVRPMAHARDEAVAERLWQLSEEATERMEALAAQ